MGLAAVDLFCGVGGLTRGLEDAGIPVLRGVDVDPVCEYPYEANNHAEFVEADVSDLTGDELASWYPENVCRILAGCPPCQPFSNLTNGEDTSEWDDWRLLDMFVRLVEDVRPEIVCMENVRELRNHDIYSEFVNELFRLDYDFSFTKVDCREYGIPQDRRRLVLVASRLGPIEIREPTRTVGEYRTVREQIGDLPPTGAGEMHPDDHLHFSRTLSDTNLERIRLSKPGGTWHDWDEELLLECHKKESGRSFASVYGRMEWDEPSPTITTQFYNYGSGRFGHPEQDRAISLREGAMLQTFPQDYAFVEKGGDVEFHHIGRLVGNAVPVRLGEVIGETIQRHAINHDVTDRFSRQREDRSAVRNVTEPQRVESPGAEPVQ